jgi:hypothetical protein
VLSAMLLLLVQAGKSDERRPEEIEPLQTKTGYPLERGDVQADLVYTLADFDEGSSDDLRAFEGRASQLAVELTYGVTEAVTAELRVPYAFLDPDDADEASGWGDVEIDVKAGLPKGKLPFADAVSGAVGLRLTVPTGDDERGLGQAEPEWRLYLALSGEAVPLAVHVQPYLELEDDRRGQAGLNMALEAAPFGPDVSLYLGFNGLWERGEGTIGSVIPGAGYRTRTGGGALEVGVGLPIGITDDSEEWALVADVQISY